MKIKKKKKKKKMYAENIANSLYGCITFRINSRGRKYISEISVDVPVALPNHFPAQMRRQSDFYLYNYFQRLSLRASPVKWITPSNFKQNFRTVTVSLRENCARKRFPSPCPLITVAIIIVNDPSGEIYQNRYMENDFTVQRNNRRKTIRSNESFVGLRSTRKKLSACKEIIKRAVLRAKQDHPERRKELQRGFQSCCNWSSTIETFSRF